jgi:hypothetical protein
MVAKTLKSTAGTSVADPGCLSRIPDTAFYPSRITDTTTAPKVKGKKYDVLPYFEATNIIKIVKNLIF